MRVRIDAKAFGARQVLRDVAFAQAEGEILALVGPSGAGKTTLLRIVAGLDGDFAGTVEGRGRIGLMFQSPTLLPWRSARDNVAIPTRIAPDRADAALAEVGLARRETAYPGALSLGQQRRVALARACAADPDLLLLDEPFVSLDPEAAQRMRDLTLAMLARRGARAILVTHDLAEAAAMADRALALSGAPAKLVAERRFDRPRPARDPAWIAAEAEALRAAISA
ncbi:MAG: ABC transporter ATP-binding protein [Rubrimonas sp.]